MAKVTNDAGRLDEARSAMPLPTDQIQVLNHSRFQEHSQFQTSVALMNILIDV
jgi:hypothetical protein